MYMFRKQEYGDTTIDLTQSMGGLSNPLLFSMKDGTAENKHISIAQNAFLLKDGAVSETLEENRHTISRIKPKAFRQRSHAIGDGIERYNPDVRTIFWNNTYSLNYNSIQYNAYSVQTINLSQLKVPESHISKQVLVQVESKYRLGNLKVVFSKMNVLFKRNVVMAGILLQEPAGTSNGVYESTHHFDCPDNHAVFVLISEVYVPII